MKTQNTDILSASVSSLAGVGSVKRAAYEKMGIRTLADLIEHYPRSYENRGEIMTLLEARMRGGKCAVVLTVAHEAYRKLSFAEIDALYGAGRRVLLDIKGILHPSDFVSAGYLYRRL